MLARERTLHTHVVDSSGRGLDGIPLVVTLMGSKYDRNDESTRWLVEEIMTGQRYGLLSSTLGPALTDMEVLAWAAR